MGRIKYPFLFVLFDNPIFHIVSSGRTFVSLIYGFISSYSGRKINSPFSLINPLWPPIETIAIPFIVYALPASKSKFGVKTHLKCVSK